MHQMKNITIKQELSEEEFQKIISFCESYSNNHNKNESITFCSEKTKEIIPADDAGILFFTLSKEHISLSSHDKNIIINASFEEESAILNACKLKQPLIINDASRSFLYNDKIDNFHNLRVKSILLVPIMDKSKTKNVIALIWAVIAKGNLNQYTQKDIDYIVIFSYFIRNLIETEALSIVNISSDTMDYKNAYEELIQKNKLEHTYFSSIIHDVRTPLNAVLGYLELLLMKESDINKQEYIEVALKSGEAMIALINDVLDISKISSGKMDIEKVTFSPFVEFSDIAKLFFNASRKKEIYFDCYFDPMLPIEIISDYYRIKQIVNNLLSNAIKFTPKGGEIKLSFLYIKEDDAIEVSVEDTGIGIAKEKQKAIFSPYTQEKNSTSREYGGTGLGLSISHQLVVLLGGKLEIESETGKGSRFFFKIHCNTITYKSLFDTKILKDKRISLFLSDIAIKECNSTLKYIDNFASHYKTISDNKQSISDHIESFDTLIIMHQDAIIHEMEIARVLDAKKAVLVICDILLKEECRFSGNVKRLLFPILPNDLYETLIDLNQSEEAKKREKYSFEDDIERIRSKNLLALVVDDNPINLKLMRELLKNFSIATEIAQNGDSAIDIISQNNTIDLIFMDQNMPIMNGDEAIRIIRNEEKTKNLHTKIVIGLSGDASIDAKNTFIEAGADDVLTKPVHLSQIIKTILKYF